MKPKYIYIAFSVLLIGSVAYILEQRQEIDYLNEVLQAEKDITKQRSVIIDDLSEEKNILWNEVAQLKHELNKTKDAKIAQRQYSNVSEGVEYRVVERILIRSHHTDGSAVIGEAPAGGIVEVLDSFFEHKWKIRYNGIVGWVRTDNRSAQDQIVDDMNGLPERKTLERIR